MLRDEFINTPNTVFNGKGSREAIKEMCYWE
jgi:hypothetical protein